MDKDKLQNAGVERAILASIAKYGSEGIFEIEELISEEDFYYDINKNIYKIFKYLVKEKDVNTFDYQLIFSGSKKIFGENIFDNAKNKDYLESIFYESKTDIPIDNIKKLAAIIYKLSFARRSYICLRNICKKLLNIMGEENVSDIIQTIEDPIFELTGEITGKNTSINKLGIDFKEFLESKASSPKDIVGLPSGFPKWDETIGGGLRPGTVHIVGARPKRGKSFFCLNVAKNLAEHGIPVLYLDTELTKESQLTRFSSLMTGIDINTIETGQFTNNQYEYNALLSTINKITDMPFYHYSIAGQSCDFSIALARRWLYQYVGFDKNGNCNPCLILYDYIKLMDDTGFKRNLQEYQLLGFMMTALHNFATKWNIPILATVQLNRDGIEMEGSQVISGSDRILWLCSSFSILKSKTPEELTDDPPSNGSKKIIVLDTRFGKGMEPGEYINVIDNLSCASMKEGKLKMSGLFTGNNKYE